MVIYIILLNYRRVYIYMYMYMYSYVYIYMYSYIYIHTYYMITLVYVPCVQLPVYRTRRWRKVVGVVFVGTNFTMLNYLVIPKLSGIIQWWYKQTKLKPTGETGGALDIFYTHELNIKHSSTITGPLGTDNGEKKHYLGERSSRIVNGWKKQLDSWNIP